MDDDVVLAPRGIRGRPQVKRERADRLIAALVIEAQQINNDPLAQVLPQRAIVHDLRNLANVSEQADDPGAFLTAVDAAEYLSRHGIACEIVEMERGNQTVAQALLNCAAARGAAYLVVGAYGHARSVETVFGGVTRELFADPPLPVFTAH